MQDKSVFLKRSIYNHDDSAKVFILAIFCPFILSFFASIIAGSIADAQGITKEDVTSNYWFYIVYTLLTALVYIGIWYFYSKLKDINPVKAIGFKAKQNWKNYLFPIIVGILCLFGFQYLVQAFDNLLKVIGYPVEEGFGAIDPKNVGEYFYSIFTLALIPAIIEELIYRGVIFRGLRERFSTSWSVVISSVMFMFVHGNLQQFIYPLLLGSVLALIVARTGSLLSSMIVHFINNFLVVTFRFVENLTGFNLDLPNEWWLYLVAVVAATVALLVVFLIDKFVYKHKNASVENDDCGTVSEDSSRTADKKISSYLYISLAIGAVMYIISVVSHVFK